MEFIFLKVETDNKQIYNMSGVISCMKKTEAGHRTRDHWAGRCQGSQDFKQRPEEMGEEARRELRQEDCVQRQR